MEDELKKYFPKQWREEQIKMIEHDPALLGKFLANEAFERIRKELRLAR